MKKVITYGTFDLFHIGHYNILKRAKELGDYLIVAVTGETYDAERGKLSVQDSLATRIDNVRKTGFADKIIVEEYLGQKIADIIKYNVDILVVGSDWKGKFDHLNKYCKVVYLERTKDISSTQLRETVIQTYRLGIVTDDLYDAEAVIEPKYVSGIHVESVYSEDAEVAKKFSEIYELGFGFHKFDEFLDTVDIVYIKTQRNKRYHYIKECIRAGKHVLCDSPHSLSLEEEKELDSLAKENKVVLLDNIAVLYLQAFSQLLWNARGNLIGDLISIKCGISKEAFDEKKDMDFIDLSFYPICAILKLLGTEYDSVSSKLIQIKDEKIQYGILNFYYNQTVATVEIGFGVEVSSSMRIVGTKGTILVPNDWWRIGYLKMKGSNDKEYKRYSFNFEGNGMRYIVQEMLAAIREQKSGIQKLNMNELEMIIKIMLKL